MSVFPPLPPWAVLASASHQASARVHGEEVDPQTASTKRHPWAASRSKSKTRAPADHLSEPHKRRPLCVACRTETR